MQAPVLCALPSPTFNLNFFPIYSLPETQQTMDNVGETDEHTAHAPKSHSQGPTICCHGIEGGRNLVVSIDGTGQQFGTKNTNVVEMHGLLNKDKNQLTMYHSGIGTYARPSRKSFSYYKQVLYHKIDLALAWEVEKTIMTAYSWLSDNYEDGDRIFLFGYSRGALQVRALSAMIEKVGLLHKLNSTQVPFAYEIYADPRSKFDQDPAEWGKMITQAELFKNTFCHEDVRVHFIGAWDTVSSIGAGNEQLPGTVDGMKHVCFFRHALALDERRVKFLPEYANGGRGPDQEATSGSFPHTKEVWFAGTHSDIGGGNMLNPALDRTRPPLRWMVYEAGPLGLRMSPFKRDLQDNEKVAVKESLSWVWWPFEYFPFRRLTYTRKEKGKETTHSLHRGKVRKIQPGQKIHVSVVSSANHIPKASGPPLSSLENTHFWGSLKEVARGALSNSERRELYERWVEVDLLIDIKTTLESLLNGPGSPLDSITKLLQRDEGLRTFYEAVLAMLQEDPLDQDGKDCLIEESLSILGPTKFKFQLSPMKEVRKRIGNPRIDDRAFLNCFSQIFQTYPKFNSQPYSVAFSPDGKWLASGYREGTVRILDSNFFGAQTGNVLGRHSKSITSVAFSPDSKSLVSGSMDHTICLWDTTKMERVGAPWKGHTNDVCCVAFSPDGTMVVSGSVDNTVRLWDPETGKEIVVLKGHEDYVQSVAFSPDSLHIASGSNDETVCIWDARTYQQVGEPLKGYTYRISSVAYSPNGKQIASGSEDTTIHLWDADTMVQVGRPLQGHSDCVRSVCFSPNGKLLASGSDDCTIRIWNANTGAQIGEGLRGHGNWVWSVAFSPDGKQLASASEDGTIRIWDIESYVYLHSIGSDL
ncbi:hypothetical protein D9613_011521 [Agrocybe pediades]|uniref:DUF2235 domain-containing protein n=1 Tax=Agrocybe pediades TaxID=84607 RepID=A0A8H4VPL5_9AGAR|nr:hypothetical protein D9613_011521 [Agrocybe pediades]